MRLAWAAVFASFALGQGLEPRLSASDYPASTSIGEVSIGAEFLARSLPSPDGMLVTRGYLVVEVAMFGPAVSRAVLSPSLFSIRVNGDKAGILAQQPFVVVSAFDPPPPGTQPSLTLGRGGTDVIFGDPGRRPVDPSGTGIPPVSGNPPGTRTPPRSPSPYEDLPRHEPLSPREAVERAALPSGDVKLPQAGVLFFAYSRDLEKIQTLELIYEGPAGKGSIKLR